MEETKVEELEKEAEVFSYKLYHSKAWNPSEDMLVKAYLAGAEPREKRIAELEAQIEEMKCCGNCAKYNSGYGENPCKIGASMICGEWETSIGKF